MLYRFYQWLWIVLDWLLPPRCAGCGAPGTNWCQECQRKVVRVMPPICDICGERISRGKICARCLDKRPRITAVRSWAVFREPVRNAVHQLKYKRQIGLGWVLCDGLLEVIENTGWQIDLVMPVPLGVARHKERGYNQASLLALPLALKRKYRYAPKALIRTRETRSQVDLNRDERKQNVSGAFSARAKLVEGKSILVVDDVTTSGATLDACADALLKAGAKDVYGLTLAQAE